MWGVARRRGDDEERCPPPCQGIFGAVEEAREERIVEEARRRFTDDRGERVLVGSSGGVTLGPTSDISELGNSVVNLAACSRAHADGACQDPEAVAGDTPAAAATSVRVG